MAEFAIKRQKDENTVYDTYVFDDYWVSETTDSTEQ